MSASQRDGRQAPAIVAHALQRVAAIAEEIVPGRQRIVAGCRGSHAGKPDATHEIACQVEQEMAGTRGVAEESRVRWILGQEGGRVLCTARQIVVLNSILIWLKYHEIIEFENIHAWASKIANEPKTAVQRLRITD